MERVGSPWGTENGGGKNQGSRARSGRRGKLEQWFWVCVKPFLHPPYWPGMREPGPKLLWPQKTAQVQLPCGQLRGSRQLVWVSVRVSLHMGRGSSVHLFICLSICLFDCSLGSPSVCPIVYLSMCLFICLSISSSISLCMFIHPPIYQNDPPSIHHLSVHLLVLFHISLSHLILWGICTGSQKTHTIITNKQTHAQKNRKVSKAKKLRMRIGK